MTAERADPIGPDGLTLPEVGVWAESKYKLVEIYSQMFTTSMRGKWTLAYVDLFAAAGLGRVKGTRRIVPGTAVCALRTPTQFDRYILCEADPQRLAALEARVRRDFPRAGVVFFEGDSNAMVARVVAELPLGALTFCTVDPSRIADLRFSTIERLSLNDQKRPRRIDFLVLIPSYMDAHRERKYYVEPGNTALAGFLGNADWREDWKREATGRRPRDFGVFVVDAFGRAMEKLGYLWDIKDATLISGGGKPLYHLAFFSRHQLGRKFAREARRYAGAQLGFQW